MNRDKKKDSEYTGPFIETTCSDMHLGDEHETGIDVVVLLELNGVHILSRRNNC